MISIKNYFQHTAPSVKKIGLAMRVLIASITGSSFVQGNVKMAFYCLLAGGLIDFILQCLPPGDMSAASENQPAPQALGGINKALVLFNLLAISVMINGCTVVRPGTNTSKTDTTITTYKQVDIKVAGAIVSAGLNMDSLYHAALMAKDQRTADSILWLNTELKFKQDSIAALKANKPIPPKPVYIPSPPQKQYVTDPKTKAQLAYWIDAYGKFQITCESKDQTIATLQAQVTKLTKQVSSTTVTVPQTPVWAKVAMILEGICLVIAILIIVFKSIL